MDSENETFGVSHTFAVSVTAKTEIESFVVCSSLNAYVMQLSGKKYNFGPNLRQLAFVTSSLPTGAGFL